MFCNKCNNYYSLSKNLPGEDNSTSFGFYTCESCSNYEKIPNNTLLFKKSFKKAVTRQNLNYSHLDIYPRQNNYNCPNKDCKTHNSNYNRNKVASIVKDKHYQVYMVCLECHHRTSVRETEMEEKG